MARVVETPRGSFFVKEDGPTDGPTLVLVAGLGDDHASWEDPIRELAGRYRCITFDNRGIGRSLITPGPYTTRGMADDAHAVAEALGLSAVSAVGSSMGGAICQQWALAHPGDVGRLILSNTWGGVDVWFGALIEHWIQLAHRGAGSDVLYQLGLFCFSPDFLASHPGTIDEFVASGMPDIGGFVAAGRACQTHDALATLHQIAVPTLVIGGRSDILTRPKLSQLLAAEIPGAELAWLAAGHMTFWELPAEWAELVDAFVSRT